MEHVESVNQNIDNVNLKLNLSIKDYARIRNAKIAEVTSGNIDLYKNICDILINIS